MKKQMWICTVLAAAFILAACGTPAKAADANIDTKNEESLLRAAQTLFEMKMYEQTRDVLLKVKEKNPSNSKASLLLARVNAELEKNGEAKAKRITQKDMARVIPQVDFTEAQLSEVVNYLSVKCSINIVISEEAKWMMQPAMSNPFEQENTTDVFGDAEKKDDRKNVFAEPEPKREARDLGGITIRLKDVPLSTVLKYVLMMKNLTYVVEDYAIVIVPKNLDYDGGNEMIIETFKVYGGLFGSTTQLGPGY
jgi:hypothetical protein